MTVLKSLLVMTVLGMLTAGTAFGLTQASFDVKNPENQE